jgi:drug/metabolite transporter (DMT)-like permease
VAVEEAPTDDAEPVSAPARMPGSHYVMWAIVVYAVSFMIFPVSDALAKRLALRYPVAEIAAIRFGTHFLIVCGAVVFRYGIGALRTGRPATHLLRGALMATTTLFIFEALRTTSLADVTIILFVAPLFVVALSGPALGEKVCFGQWAAVGTGLAGVVLVIRPTLDGFGWGMALAMVAAICSALYQIVSRQLARTERPLVGLFYLTLVGTGVLGALAMPTWRAPLLEDLAQMILMGLIAAAGYFGIFKAIELAPPARLAPFYYLQIVTAVALGYAVFGEMPDVWAMLGMAVIIAAGLVCLALEQSRRGAGVSAARHD